MTKTKYRIGDRVIVTPHNDKKLGEFPGAIEEKRGEFYTVTLDSGGRYYSHCTEIKDE